MNFVVTIKIFFPVFSLVFFISVLNLSIYAEENTTEPEFFAIQHAESGSITNINSTLYLLELNNISEKTILFSDRPDRIVEHTSTLEFIDSWAFGKDNFLQDPPNGVLVINSVVNESDLVLMELIDPVYDMDKKTLQYSVVINNLTSIELYSIFDQATLLIDSTDYQDRKTPGVY